MEYALGLLGWLIIAAIVAGRGALYPDVAVGTILLYLALVTVMLIGAAAMFKKAGSFVAFCGEAAWWIVKHAAISLWFLVCLVSGLVWGFTKWLFGGIYRFATGKPSWA